MAAGSAKDSDRSTPRLVKLSELARLSGVSRPTIKHYLRCGLLPGPVERTSRNMAYYDARLAARVRTIKELQRTCSLSLDTISSLLEPAPSHALRDDLDEHERGQLGPAAPAAPPDLASGREPASVRLTRTEVLAALKIGPEDLDVLERTGLARPIPTAAGEPVYSGPALHLLEIVHDARQSGLDALVAPEPLRAYASAMRAVITDELASWPARLARPSSPRPGPRDPTEQPDAIARLGQRLLAAIHAAIAAHALEALRDAHPGPESQPAK